MPSAAQIVRAPGRPPFEHKKKLFLAGTTPVTGQPDWRATVVDAVAAFPVIVLDPVRPDWDSTWREDVSCQPYYDQVQWELDMQETADILAVYFDPAKDGMISLLELGLCARSHKRESKTVVVGCPPGYVKRGNVQIVCERFGITMVESAEQLALEIVERLG